MMKRISWLLATLALPACLQSTAAATTADADSDAADAAVTVCVPVGDQAVTAPATWLSVPDNTPKSVHQTWQHDPATTATVQWTTAATDLAGYTPKVWFDSVCNAKATGADMRYGTSATATGSGEIYYQTLTDITPDTPKYITWTVELTGLAPDTDYVFRAGTWSDFTAGAFVKPDLSDVQHFRTAPGKGTRKAFNLVLAGDSRGGTEKIRTHAERLSQFDAAFWVFNGDFNEVGQQDQWDDWFDAMRPILSKSPLMPVQGNHEVFPPMFYGQFALPIAAGVPDAYKEHAWSMHYANVHFVGLDSTTDAGAQDQSAWLDADLQSARADKDVDWIIAMMHHPAYSASNHGSTDYVQKWWVPLFEQHKVDLIFAGHDHDYERSKPWVNGSAVAKGPVYVVAGAFYADGYSNGNGAWTAISADGKQGNYVQMTIDGKTMSYTAFSGDGKTTLDTYTLQK
jgi:hypothetical protein